MADTKPAATPWLPGWKPNPQATLRLFCFPYAGGSTLIYRNWQESLPPDTEVCPVQLTGRGSRLREPMFRSMPQLIDALAPALLPYLDKPFAFFGHSMGAIAAFELARRLRTVYAKQPAQLLVSGRRAPQIPDTDPFTYDLPDAEFIEELRRLNGTPKEVLLHAELMQVMLPLLRADFELIQTYRYTSGPPLDCPIAAFGGIEDGDESQAFMDAWREQTTAAFSLHMFPGDHFFLHSARPQLLRAIALKLHPSGRMFP